MWFDRGLDFGHGSLVDAQLGNLPRVITSRSLDRQTTDSRLMSKREVKIAAVEWAISALLAVDAVGRPIEKRVAESVSMESSILIVMLVAPCLLYALFLIRRYGLRV